MKMIFSHTDIAFVQYLQKVLEERGIQCLVKNDNVAIAGLSERTVFDLTPELHALDDSRVEEAEEIVNDL